MSDPTTDPAGGRMDCARVVRDGLAELYVSGQLPDETRDAFEQHFFDCTRCSEELDVYLAMQTELQRTPAISAAPTGRKSRRTAWLALAAAAVVVLAAVLWRPRGSQAPAPPLASAPAAPEPGAPLAPVVTLAELTAVDPPPYRPPTVRGATDAATRRFRQAMEAYRTGDFAGAIAGLEDAAALDSSQASIQFFLGACYLLTDDVDGAVRRLRATVALGESAYLEEAHFYLAKAYLRRNETDAARAELTTTIALGGEREQEARRLLEQIEKLGGTPRGR